MGCWLSGPWSDQTLNGRSLTHLSQRDALQILAAAQHPITMQIKSQRRGQKADHASSWEPLPLGLQHLNLPRSFYSQLPVPPEHCDPRFGFMSSSPRDTLELGLQDPELSRGPKEPGCLDCCGSTGHELNAFTSQPDEDDFLLDPPVGYLPLHHELDSGLGWTDGSVHQGELSGMETEEGGVDECLPRPGLTPGGCTGLGGSPSSESFISSELSDSGFYSVSTGEFRHFQRLLEKRMRLYNARLQLQNEPCERRERRDSCPKSHLLEAIPESLPIHRGGNTQEGLPIHRGNQESLPIHRPSPDSLPPPPCPQHGHESDLDLPQRGLFRVSSVQFHKSDRPSLNRHSSSSGALFNPAHSVMSRLNAPVLSTCSTPSSHRRGLMPHGPLQPPPQPLRRSRTLHYRPPQAEYRRRASHPASPSYYTLNQCPTAAAMLEQHMHNSSSSNDHNNIAAHCCDANASYEQYWRERSEHSRSIPDNLVMEREREQQLLKQELEREMEQQRLNQMEQEHQRLIERERERERQRLNHLELEQKLKQMEVEREKEKRQKEQEQKEERERQMKEERERQMKEEREATVESNRRRFRENTSSFSQSGEANDTWPKPASRSLQHSGGSRGMYSTLDTPAGSASGGRGMCGAVDASVGSASGGRGMCGAVDASAGAALGGERGMCGAVDASAGSALGGGRGMCGAVDASARSASGGRGTYGALEGPAGSVSCGRGMCGVVDVSAGSASCGRGTYGAVDTSAGSASCGRGTYGAVDTSAGSASCGRGTYGAVDTSVGSASCGRGTYGAVDANLGSVSCGRGSYAAVDANTGSSSPAWDMKKAQLDSSPLTKPTAATRVSRSQMLRDRALALADERSGMSTDEEASADMLLGRYWSRTERKEHFLLARELRQQQQARGDRSSSREREEQDPRSAHTLLELSHRKLTRLRNRKLLDDWTTVEELLTHGSRLDNHEDALTCPSSLLTVTTV